MSHLLFNPDPTGGFMPENEVTDNVMGLMMGGLSLASYAYKFPCQISCEGPDICDKVQTEQLEIASDEAGTTSSRNIQRGHYWTSPMKAMQIPQGVEGVLVRKHHKQKPREFRCTEVFDPSRFENGKAPQGLLLIFPFGQRSSKFVLEKNTRDSSFSVLALPRY
ncbi:hypothetical protein L3X38_006118 [Prunus dulcis]|uniref:Uncharacterized protein n=1 Tax=Prunus dulcis TaxID=3755 RepID=A0AAD5F4W0_PRUDU|nr:hypothetical protein L3X38_006118 [Prunus dulcis]